MTIANVTVPNMAGALGAGSSQGTWVITSYAVAEAITVPLTGLAVQPASGPSGCSSWRCSCSALFSLLCGMSTSLGMLLGMRVLQGMAGGPLLALSQTLLLRIFPKKQSMQAMGLWAMTTLLAPVVGPVLGGWLCDNYTWSYVFFINVPMAFALRRDRLGAAAPLSRLASQEAGGQDRHAAARHLGRRPADHAR